MQRFQSSWRPGFGHVPLVLIMALLLYPGLQNIVVYLHSAVTGSYISGTHSVVFISCPNEQVGKIIARTIMEKKLAACVNIVPEVFSMYSWDSEITETIEVLMVIKTRSSKMHELTEFIRSVHPFEIPEVISLSVDQGNPLYLKWIEETVPDE
ncbi:protein CutA homolog isoform X1 [Scyliorhinus canicula]|uniref:protein CutA homolog isoform X1 n=2 Tax=Scyliorhinus canicula TaxID=7830 RepID=UPI0018F67DB1|nr:protein CutA homolog isoform X1 [Scyliorhinus canicula]